MGSPAAILEKFKNNPLLPLCMDINSFQKSILLSHRQTQRSLSMEITKILSDTTLERIVYKAKKKNVRKREFTG
jgi:hypothetical protein